MSSKMNNYSGRRQDKNVNYVSNRNAGHGQDDKRPSVFDRLGVRREVGSSGSGYSHGHQERPEGQTFKRLDHKSNVRQAPSAGSGSQMASAEKKRPYNRDRDTYKGRSHSSSPKRKGNLNSSVHNKKKMKGKSGSSYQSDSNVSRSKYNTIPARNSSTGKAKQRSSIKGKGKADKKIKKSKKSKSNARSSSVSSDDSSSGGNSSSSGSSGSQSSSSSYSSSSSSSADSSSDSSVPSVKLKPERKSKNKKKIKEKSKNKSDKSAKKTVVSSSSSVDPHEDAPKGQQWNAHRRDKQGSKDIASPMQDDKIGMNRDSRKDRYQRDYPEETRKRKLSGGGGYEADFKRSRLTPPQNKVKTAPMRSLSPRRAPPAPGTPLTKLKQDESPMTGGRERVRLLHTPPRRQLYEEPRKSEPPKEKSNIGNNLVRARDLNYDTMQSRPQNTERYGYDKPGYKKEEMRPRERIAPTRNQAPGRRRMTPDSERDRSKESQKDYEMRPKGPLLSTPFLPPTHERNKPSGMMLRQHMDDDRRMNMKSFSNEPFRRHSPLLVKTKEELSEKYDELKLSRVDMWVDETLKGTGTVRDMEPEKAFVPKRINLDKKSPAEIKDKFSSTGEISEMRKPEVDDMDEKEEQFSDFSDDADEILNKEVEVKFDDTPERTNDPTTTAKEKSVEPAESVENVKTASISEEVIVTEKVATPEQPEIKYREREPKNVASLRSQSQTEDDIFELAFEEISDEELGEVENKIGIVDALGVDWASLVCEKKYGSADSDVKPSVCRVRERWRPLEIIKQVGISKKYLGEELTSKIAAKIAAKDGQVEDFGYPRVRQNNKHDKVLERMGLGPNSRALSSRRDMATRYCFMEMLPRSLISVDLFRQSTTTTPAQETD